MKVTASSGYISRAKGASRAGSWSLQTRTVTDISLSLSSGTWTDISDRLAEVPDIVARLEYAVGQNNTDSIELALHGITWLRANIFTSSVMADATKYIEIKLEYSLEGASDSIPAFYGFIDKDAIRPVELEDLIYTVAYTSQDLGHRVAAENLTTRYVETDVDGAGTDGLILHDIPGLFPTDANLSSYVLKVGEHKIDYELNGGERRARLDGGEWVMLTTASSTYQLGDGKTAAEDTQRLEIYASAFTEMPTVEDTFSDYVVVLTAGDTLPFQWYSRTAVRVLLGEAFSAIGIDSVTFDSLQMNTWDGGSKLSWVDGPPNDSSISGAKYALESDGTDLFIGVGNKVYRRVKASDSYSLLCTLETGYVIKRIFYSYRSGDHEDLWILYLSGTTLKLNVYRIDTATLLTSTTLSTVLNSVAVTSMTVLDYNYTGSSWKYALVYSVDVTGSDKGFIYSAEYSGSTISLTQRFNAPYDPVSNGYGFLSNFMYKKSAGLVRVQCTYTASARGYDEFTISSGGAWTQNPNVFATTAMELYDLAAYHPSDDRVYHFASSINGIKSHPADSFSSTTNATFDASGEDCGWIIYGGGKVWFTTHHYALEAADKLDEYNLYSLTGNPGSPTFETLGAYCNETLLTYAGDRIYGLSANRVLFQYHTTLGFYVPKARFPRKSITSALNEMLQAFNLVSTIGGAKTGFVFRRGDHTGAPADSGYTLALTDDEVAEVYEDTNKYLKCALVKVAGETEENTYDGTNFGVEVLSDKRLVDLNNQLIPDALVDDMAYYIYQFFKTSRTVYRVLVDVPLFQYEPFDECVLALGSGKIPVSASGVIYGTTLRMDGSMLIEVLI